MFSEIAVFSNPQSKCVNGFISVIVLFLTHADKLGRAVAERAAGEAGARTKAPDPHDISRR